MLDFLLISSRMTKTGVIEIYPKFIIKRSSDLMIRGGDFYAVWIEDKKLWSTDEQDALQMIDRELDTYAKENKERLGGAMRVSHMWDAESGMIDAWHKYCQRQMRDAYHPLDERLIFANTETKKEDYASKKLPYPLQEGFPAAWDELIGTLYAPEERRKIEWAIGSIVSGDSQYLQKFMVLYGAAGTGKSTILNVIQQLFDGYTSVFDARALGSSNNSFALEAFRSNPLVAIQHDGDLSHIEDNTRLNSLVSHETMTVNEKFRSAYESRFKCFLFMGTNKPVKITDAKSGLIRRLIDVSPTGNKLPKKKYTELTNHVKFELGSIATYCRDIYLNNKHLYDDYVPTSMLGASNDFYNFIQDAWFTFDTENQTSLKSAWELYKNYCDDAKVGYPYSLRAFKEEMKNYWQEFLERETLSDGTRVRNLYRGFRREKFFDEKKPEGNDVRKLAMDCDTSKFDILCKDCPAQYAKEDGTPNMRWDSVKTTLSDLDTSRLHYVKVPLEHIVIDFDIPNKEGEKDLERNLLEASKWPPTYAQLSKSGKGVHLHYLYTGDPAKLSRIFEDHVEIKVFTGNSSLRRMLTKCNDLDIATISSGLPLKEEKPVINGDVLRSEKSIRTMILRNLNKEYHKDTRSSVDFINKILSDAYARNDISYDVSDMKGAVVSFAAGSTHQAEACLKIVAKMHFKSKDLDVTPVYLPDPVAFDKSVLEPIVFFDIEVFPNLFIVCWKRAGKNRYIARMINPTKEAIETLMKFRLVGFNCRKYDNHLLYARLLGETNEQLYKRSQAIIAGSKDAFFSNAYNLSYTDVYDFSSKKQSLKKFEIELGIHHQELGLPWDQPVPEELWDKVASYCDNDVIATEAVFEARKSDFLAREILADVAGLTPNDTTNSLTTRIIFGTNKFPQNTFNYRYLA